MRCHEGCDTAYGPSREPRAAGIGMRSPVRLASIRLLTHNHRAAIEGTDSRNALRQADHTARPLRLSPARFRADRRHGRTDGIGLADPVTAVRRAGGEPWP